jgi:hypothetical protein
VFALHENSTTEMSSTKQDKQCTYNVTVRRVRAAIVALEEQRSLHNLSVCVCSLSYPACNARTPYCYVACPHSKTFFHIIT